jgi:hypothetical protein
MVTMNAETSTKAFPTSPHSPPSPRIKPLTNAVIQILTLKGNNFKNFGQCIIFMLNRESSPPFPFSPNAKGPSFRPNLGFPVAVTDGRGNGVTVIDTQVVVFDIYYAGDV